MKPDFDRLSREYAQFRIGYSPLSLETLVREAGEGAMALDVGTGTGLLAAQLRRRLPRVIGLDVARTRLARPGPPAVKGVAERLPFARGIFQLVASAEAFHWFDRDLALAEFRRVLRPGGLTALLWKTPVEDEPYQPLSYAVFREL